MLDDNNIYITGFNSSKICLFKFNSSGSLLLNRSWGYRDWGTGYGISLDSMGCIYITDFISYSSGVNKSLVLLKYNSSGHLVWNNTLGSSYSQGNDIYVTENGDIYVTGFKRNGNNDDISLMKYNSSGDLVMERLWGGPEDEYGYSFTLDDTGNMLITGNKKITLNDYDLCILKYNPHGSLEWEKQWEGDEYEN